MTEFITRFLVAGVVMAVIDAIWLSVVASRFYRAELGGLLLTKPQLLPAVIFYIIYVLGIVFFVINPTLERDSWLPAAGYGALFGLISYATYDLTNLATIQGFSIKVVVVDLVWGTCLSAAVALITYLILH